MGRIVGLEEGGCDSSNHCGMGHRIGLMLVKLVDTRQLSGWEPCRGSVVGGEMTVSQ